MLDILTQKIQQSQADYSEIHYDSVSSSRVVLSNDQIESIGSARTASGNARSLSKGGWGLATFNHEDFDTPLRLSQENAHLVERDHLELPSTQAYTADISTEFEQDPDSWTLEQKLELAQKYNEILKDERIASTRVIYSDYTVTKHLVNSNGSAIKQQKTFTGVMVAATARDGNNVQQAFESVGQYGGLELVQGLEAKAEAVKERAIHLLEADTCEAGNYRVLLDPNLAGVFAHEAFGHLSEADFLAENPRMQDVMVLGREFGPEILTIIDDGSLKGLAGYTPYDDEGVPASASYLIKKGKLNGRLHSRETAGRLGEALTGNARALSPGYAPIVRMTNTYIDQGTSTLEEMLSQIDDGIYALDMLGGMTNLEMFTFSAGYAYRVKNGQIKELLRDVVLSGNVFSTLQNVYMIGNDLQHHGGLGGCGKAGQSGLPVATGSPHVLVNDVLIGGK